MRRVENFGGPGKETFDLSAIGRIRSQKLYEIVRAGGIRNPLIELRKVLSGERGEADFALCAGLLRGSGAKRWRLRAFFLLHGGKRLRRCNKFIRVAVM